MLQLREFNHNHHTSRVKILLNNIRRGISVKIIYVEIADKFLHFEML